ncbi:aminopeptidase N-like isoform X2 [Uranotaenia lowii]|uniref:aminopeptidase N-like isoform X2 n=1 Tax=Uranotaenia lowii TaxID=190385 RepID=UPI0024791C42|nr:aminopeptidase N-like isoform X2 [Uranotaenia lowii]XP_055586171.1 aminopeptidase N-like isoform X2 [Uranotaenia lowii]
MKSHDMDMGGYINEGGQLKSKNGQKYTVNRAPRGKYIPTWCWYFTLFLVLALIVLSVVLLVLLITQQRLYAAENGGHSNGNSTILTGSLGGSSASSVSSSTNGFGPVTNGGSNPKKHQHDPRLNTNYRDSWSSARPDHGNRDDDYSDDDGNLAPPVEEHDEDIIGRHYGWIPHHYRLTIEPNFDRSINNGSVAINIIRDPEYGSRVLPIVLDIKNIEILSSQVLDFDNQDIAFDASYGRNNQSYHIKIKESGDFLHNVTVVLDFQGQLSDTLQGFYKGSFLEEETNNRTWFASTQFSPIDARRAFPCFDNPEMKATFDISLVHSEDKSMALSNTALIRTSVHRPGFLRRDFETTPRMSTYLVAFIVSDLELAQQSQLLAFKPQISIWSRPEVRRMTNYAHQLTVRLLPFLEQYFDLPYQMKKIDMVAVPDFGYSAMENWGLITFRESSFLVPEDNDKSSSAAHKERVALVLAHELAHQWFGNLVTPRWWNDLWLKEGFSTYMSYECLNFAEKKWRVFESFSEKELEPAFETDSLRNSHPISFPVRHGSDIRRIFDPITYSKGAALIRMMSSFLGPDAFKAGIVEYLKEYQYSNAEQEDLWEILTKQGHSHGTLPETLEVKDIMDTWTLQAGYPVITVERLAPTKLRISQQRYILPSKESSDETRWYVPISMVTKTSSLMETSLPIFWLSFENKSVEIDIEADADDYVYLNVDRTGYYRVNYDYASWKKLTNNFASLPPMTKAQLIDDAFSLARAEFIQYDIPLTLTLFLKANHQDISSWASLAKGLNFLDAMLSREPAYESFLAVMRSTLRKAFDALGFEDHPEDDHLQMMHRERIVRLACQFGIDKCTVPAQTLYRRWMTNFRDNQIPPNLKFVIYCTSLREGGVPEWNFAYKRYQETDSASEKETILSALGCSVKPWLLSKYLNMTLDPTSGILKQDGGRVFQAVAKNYVGNDIAFNFLYENIEKINKYYGDGFSILPKMIHSVTALMNQKHHKEQFDRFARKARSLGLSTIEKSIHLAEEQILNNMYWRTSSYYQLQNFLNQLIRDLHMNMY